MKPWYKSRTIWLQVATFGIAVLTLATEYVPMQYIPYILFAVGVINLALRFDTSEPVSLRPSDWDAE